MPFFATPERGMRSAGVAFRIDGNTMEYDG
ncbi:cobalamin biosynthesis protein CbiD [Burkholderia pseudomallei TSV44]|nr:cobalamin biosynthesis protein CbiD [Burkholderia pseudomallei TSV44]